MDFTDAIRLNAPQYLRWALEFRHDSPQGGLPEANQVPTIMLIF